MLYAKNCRCLDLNYGPLLLEMSHNHCPVFSRSWNNEIKFEIMCSYKAKTSFLGKIFYYSDALEENNAQIHLVALITDLRKVHIRT